MNDVLSNDRTSILILRHLFIGVLRYAFKHKNNHQKFFFTVKTAFLKDGIWGIF